MQALGKGASSIEIGIIIGIAPFTWMVASPIVGYLVSSCRNNNVNKFFFTSIMIIMYWLQLPKLGLKFSLSFGMATVGVAYVAMGYVNPLRLLSHIISVHGTSFF